MGGRRRELVFWPFAELALFVGPMSVAFSFSGFNEHEQDAQMLLLAELLGVSRRMVCRWRSGGVPDSRADWVACRLGVHPSAIWPDWFAAAPLEVG